MGTGKSSIGCRLARRLGRPFLDTDAEIERLTGKTVARIFAEDGEIRFRSEERLLCRKLARPQGLVIATGGGTVLDPENVRLLRAGGVLIGLRADPETVYRRVRRKQTRPLLRGDLRERINTLLRQRQGVYEVAEFSVNTGLLTIDQAVERILGYLKERHGIEDARTDGSSGAP